MTAFNTPAAILAALVTIATLGGIGTLANHEHRDVLAKAAASTAVAATVPVQQVVIVGKRARV